MALRLYVYETVIHLSIAELIELNVHQFVDVHNDIIPNRQLLSN